MSGDWRRAPSRPTAAGSRSFCGFTVLPRSLEERVKAQLEFVRLRHERDVENGAGYAPVPTSLEHKRPGAAREFRWQFVFGSAVARPDRETERTIRWYAHP